jgi:hypothetical protein
MKHRGLILFMVVVIAAASASVGFCETLYTPSFFSSDKEALDVLQGLKGSFFGWYNYPKQTVEIDRSGVRLFSEYIGTKMVLECLGTCIICPCQTSGRKTKLWFLKMFPHCL